MSVRYADIAPWDQKEQKIDMGSVIPIQSFETQSSNCKHWVLPAANIFLYMNGRLSKIGSVHTRYVMPPRTVYFG